MTVLSTTATAAATMTSVNAQKAVAANSFSFGHKVVFGTWRLADKASADPQDILTRIKKCIELGITTFDLAGINNGCSCCARAVSMHFFLNL